MASRSRNSFEIIFEDLKNIREYAEHWGIVHKYIILLYSSKFMMFLYVVYNVCKYDGALIRV